MSALDSGEHRSESSRLSSLAVSTPAPFSRKTFTISVCPFLGSNAKTESPVVGLSLVDVCAFLGQQSHDLDVSTLDIDEQRSPPNVVFRLAVLGHHSHDLDS